MPGSSTRVSPGCQPPSPPAPLEFLRLLAGRGLKETWVDWPHSPLVGPEVKTAPGQEQHRPPNSPLAGCPRSRAWHVVSSTNLGGVIQTQPPDVQNCSWGLPTDCPGTLKCQAQRRDRGAGLHILKMPGSPQHLACGNSAGQQVALSDGAGNDFFKLRERVEN